MLSGSNSPCLLMFRRLCGSNTSQPSVSEIQPQSGSPSSTSEGSDQLQSSEPEDEDESIYNFDELVVAVVTLFNWQHCVSNAKALASRFIQLVRKPALLASLILDVYSFSLSILLSGRKSGVDFLYPMSSLTKRQSGRLAKLILDHSRNLRQRNIHKATASVEGIDSPCVAVIDLNEASQGRTRGEYSVPADIHGFMIMLMIFETLLTLGLSIFSPAYHPINILPDPFGLWVEWVYYIVVWAHWPTCILFIFQFSAYAILRGNGLLTLVLRSGPVTQTGCAVFLDRDYAVIITGNQGVVEAIAEGSFSISHPVSWKQHKKVWKFGQDFCHEILKAVCNGIPLTCLVACFLALHPSSFLLACVPLFPAFGASAFLATVQLGELPYASLLQAIALSTLVVCTFGPSYVLFLAYELVVAKQPLLRGLILLEHLLHYASWIPFIIFLISSQDFHIRTTKFLDILGNPPVRRWEFDTLAAVATFQCLVLCRGITRPIKTVDVLALLDTLIPDQTDVWIAWKNRVADRITYEVDIKFEPTVPTFGDQRQQRLVELLDQARVGYDAFRKFYDWHVPLYSTGSLL